MLRKYSIKQWMILLVTLLPMIALHVMASIVEAVSDIEYTLWEILFGEVKLNFTARLSDKVAYFENYMNLKLGKYFRGDGTV